MEFLSATGQVMFAVFLAVGQFLEPLRPDYVTQVEQSRAVQDWEYQVYNFTPVSLGELYTFSNEELALYIRSSCLGMLDQMIPENKRNQGSHFLANISDTIINIVDPVQIEKKQTSLIEPLEEFVLAESFEFIMRACDRDFPLNYLTAFNLRQAVDRYAKFYNEIPEWQSLSDLPELPEVSFVRDLENNIIGEFHKVDTIELDGEIETVRINRRTITNDIPLNLKKALVSIEDATFWNFEPEGSENYRGHKGVEFKSFMRAGQASASTDGIQGGSTITMQLAKNLILFNDVHVEQRKRKRSMFRKVRELILSSRLEKLLTKDQILDLYLNTIDFGRRSQGVEMASKSYFGKSIKDVELHEAALIAALPKGPNYYNPGSSNPDTVRRTLVRRNYVLKRMHDEGHISASDMTAAQQKPIEVISGSDVTEKEKYAHFYVSQVEKEISKKSDSTKGFDITVPIHHDLQKMAVESLQKGLLDFERRKGRLRVRSYEDRLPNIKSRLEDLSEGEASANLIALYPEVLEKIKARQPDLSQFEIGVILSNTEIGLKDGTVVRRHENDRNGKLAKVSSPDSEPKYLEAWDTVFLQKIKVNDDQFIYRIASTTKIQGGIVVIDNETGDVLATSGGFSIGAGARYKGPEANRSFISKRQPGSTVKPFTYLYALQAGFNPYNTVSNQRVRFPQRRDGERLCASWSPDSKRLQRDSMTMADGLAYSQNYATLNLMARASGAHASWNGNRLDYQGYDQDLSEGLRNVHTLMQRFGVYREGGFDRETCHPSLLGTKETTVANMAAAYSTIARGGEYIAPKLIEEITKNSDSVSDEFEINDIVISALLDDRRVSDKLPLDTYLLRTMLQGVVEKGTAKKIKRWSSVIAGKTGTTNSAKDTWFVGFNSRITVAVWVGYPDNSALGSNATGASVALPVFEYFMESFYEKFSDELQNVFDGAPEGLASVQVEPRTGFVVDSQLQNVYQNYTGRTSEIPSVTEYYVEGRGERGLIYYDGRVNTALADLFYDNLSDQRKNEISAQQKNYTDQLARNYQIYDQNCNYYLNQGYRENQISDCKSKRDTYDQYYVYEDFKKFFFIYYRFRTWESYR